MAFPSADAKEYDPFPLSKTWQNEFYRSVRDKISDDVLKALILSTLEFCCVLTSPFKMNDNYYQVGKYAKIFHSLC